MKNHPHLLTVQNKSVMQSGPDPLSRVEGLAPRLPLTPDFPQRPTSLSAFFFLQTLPQEAQLSLFGWFIAPQFLQRAFFIGMAIATA